MFTILAEAMSDVSGLAAGASALLNTSATLWFFYHTNTKTLPEQQREFREFLKEKDIAHAAELDKMRLFFAEQLKEAKADRDAILSELKSNREAFERWKNDHKG